MRRLPVIEVRDELVICGGVHATAPLSIAPDKPAPDVAGAHQLLQPVFHLGEIELSGVTILPGDVIEERSDGKRYHLPRSKGQQRPER